MSRLRIHTLLGLCLQLVSLVHGIGNSTAAVTCAVFAQNFPELVLYSQNASYTAINTDYWSAEDWLAPSCIFTPTSSEIMSYAIKKLTCSGIPFAVRGSGGMPILGAANINSSGILLATTKMTRMQLSEDNSTVSIDAGNDWASVYDFLDTWGLTVIGSRLGVVGVPGFMLGGGMSFFSNEYGWASAYGVRYEVILADGSIVNATATNEYSDLFWALRGGGNNFAIVTTFEIQTFAIPEVTVGEVTYGPGVRETFLEALHAFAHDGANDPHASVLPTISYVPAASANVTYSADLFYNGNNTSPASFVNFTAPVLTPETSTISVRTMANWTAESDEGIDSVHGETFRFYAVSILADLNAMYTLHDIFFNHTQVLGPSITGFISTMALNTITESFIITGRGDDPSGDPMGINADAAPYMYCELTIAWALANDTAAVEALREAIAADVNDKLASYLVPFLYLNNAGGGQPVFEGYNTTNLARLQSIRDKYDPLSVYTDQLVGGFKLRDI